MGSMRTDPLLRAEAVLVLGVEDEGFEGHQVLPTIRMSKLGDVGPVRAEVVQGGLLRYQCRLCVYHGRLGRMDTSVPAAMARANAELGINFRWSTHKGKRSRWVNVRERLISMKRHCSCRNAGHGSCGSKAG